jgi:sugar phosphate isomerase/epimerase
MRFSVFTDVLARPFEESLDALVSLGLETVDLRCPFDGDTAEMIPDGLIQSMHEAVRRRDLTVSCVASQAVNPLTGDYRTGDRTYRRAMRDRIIHLVEMADLFGAAHVCIYSFKRPMERITGNHRADNAVFLADMSEICARRGKLLLVENEPRTLTSTCAELADLMQRCIPPSLRISWDVVSGWRSGEIPWAENVFEPIANYVIRVHMAGARANPDGSFASMTIPGTGDIPHKSIFRKLFASGFDGTIAIDPHYQTFAEADQLTGVPDPILEVLRRSLTYFQDLLKQIRSEA